MPSRTNRIRWQGQAASNQAQSQPLPTQPAPPATPFLDRFGRDLTLLASQGRLKPLFGRQKELIQLQRILLRKEKNNPLLVGAAGVGKTALVEGLASLVVSRACAPELEGMRIVEIAAASLSAGTALRGAFEEKLEVLLGEAARTPKLLLFFDEMHTLMGAGAAGSGALDAANILKPALARGELRCIGATTPDEYDRYLKNDAAFERRFEILLLEEPTRSETIEILQAALPGYAAYHGVEILPEAVEAAVDLSSRHLPERRQPDKAFDLLDSACAYLRLPSPDAEPVRSAAGLPVLDALTVGRALAERLNIPPDKIGGSHGADAIRSRLTGLEDFLNRRIIGQPLAMRQISLAVRRAYAGLEAPAQPRHVFAFFGGSGVGKTATAIALAEFLFESPSALLRLDMSEYKEPHSIARLFGSPPGYVGYTDEGSFATLLRRQPYCVVLLDEAEKAHPQVLDAFLHIFERGSFRDGRGRGVDASHAVFILTSNLYTVPDLRTAEAYEEHAAAIRLSLGGYLRQELVNRIGSIVLFRQLALPDLQEIAGGELEMLNRRLQSQGGGIRFGEEVTAWLAQQAWGDPAGARAVQRWISRQVIEPLAGLLVETAGVPSVLEIRLENDRLTIARP